MTKTELLAIAKPILFNTEMVRAILDGRKTATRRVVKQSAVNSVLSSPARLEMPDTPDERFISCLCDARYEVGDYLYVRETWCTFPKENYHYKADEGTNTDFEYFQCASDTKWKPSIHMPREAARIFLRVTDVRVERLQDIDHATKFAAEGIEIGDYCKQCLENYAYPSCTDDSGESIIECRMLDETRFNFSYLWDRTIKKSRHSTLRLARQPLGVGN